MDFPKLRCTALLVVLAICSAIPAFSSAYNARPKLVVIMVFDQFRGDFLERYYDEFGPDGFRMLMNRGAYFNNCNYNYANLKTAPGHATIGTGAYTAGHGILTNAWWDPRLNRSVQSVEDGNTKFLGINSDAPAASPRNLLADTIGDELKLATQGRARVFGVSFKDRSAILPVGYSANAAYWIDNQTGAWVTSTYYMQQLPEWVARFNASGTREKYLNREWKDTTGNLFRTTAPNKDAKGNVVSYYSNVGGTPFGNDYELDFVRELIRQEKLGTGPVTDLLSISFSANDIMGHDFGPDSPQSRAMILAMDRQVAGFFRELDKQFGLANVWIAISADHGISPVPEEAAKFRIPAVNFDGNKFEDKLNQIIGRKVNRPGKYVLDMYFPIVFLSEEAFVAANYSEADGERIAGEAMVEAGMRGFFTKTQLAKGDVPATMMGKKFANSYSPHAGWYVMGVSPPFMVRGDGSDHALPYSYDSHVPLAFMGAPFRAGRYVGEAEPVDLAVTLSVLLGLNKPTSATGRVLTEGLVEPGARGAAAVKSGLQGLKPTAK